MTAFIILASGCSTVASRSGDASQLGIPYSGTKYGMEGIYLCNVSAAIRFFPALLFTVPITVVDTALSTIADTVILPIDLLNRDREINTYPEHMCDWGH